MKRRQCVKEFQFIILYCFKRGIQSQPDKLSRDFLRSIRLILFFRIIWLDQLPSLMPHGIDPMGGATDGLGRARRRAIMCARGVENLMFVRLTPVTFELKKMVGQVSYY